MDFPSKLTLLFFGDIMQNHEEKEPETVKYLKQLCLIFAFSFLGEVCRYVIPLNIPASIYGMLLLFAALSLKWIRLESVRETGAFLSSMLPVLFVVPAVGIMDYWPVIRPVLIPLILICLLVTILVFAASGLVAQWMIGKGKQKDA